MDQKTIVQIVQVILIVSAINWGLTAYNGMDLVNMATKGGDIEKYVKYAIAAVGAYQAYLLFLQ